MFAQRFKHVCIESIALNLPEAVVSSSEVEDRIAPLYQRLRIPFGTLEKVSGVKTRRLWQKDVMPSAPATEAARQALEESGLPAEEIKALFSCSVTRDHFEPATACLVHQNLGLSEVGMAMDITNACVGFSNGLVMMSNLIESGVVKAGIVVSAENISCIIESSIEKLLHDDSLSREELLKILPAFTLGCGSAAFVLCHESISKSGHRILGSVARSATQHSNLCVGNADYCLSDQENLDPIMITESHELIHAAARLGGRLWSDASEFFQLSNSDVDHVFCHQVGRQVNKAFYAEVGLEIEKEFTVYERYGNLVSAALPTALGTGAEEKEMKSGDTVMLLGYGSGLNGIFTAIQW